MVIINSIKMNGYNFERSDFTILLPHERLTLKRKNLLLRNLLLREQILSFKSQPLVRKQNGVDSSSKMG